jgi:hypothetical protein
MFLSIKKIDSFHPYVKYLIWKHLPMVGVLRAFKIFYSSFFPQRHKLAALQREKSVGFDKVVGSNPSSAIS